MQKLFLHAGPPKTATTLIQSQLFARRKELRKANLVYLPSREIRQQQQKSFQSYVKTGFRDLATEFANHLGTALARRRVEPHENILLSWEGVLGRSLTWNSRQPVFPYASEFLRGITTAAQSLRLDLNFIFYVRRQDEFLESLATQRLQAGSPVGFAEFTRRIVDPKKISWLRVLRTAVENLGRERVHVRLFDDIRRGPQFYLDRFLSVIDPEIRIEYDPAIFSNQSFSALGYDVAIEAFKYIPDAHDRIAFAKFLQVNCGGEKYGKCKFLSDDERADLIAFYADENREVFEAHGLSMETYAERYAGR